MSSTSPTPRRVSSFISRAIAVSSARSSSSVACARLDEAGHADRRSHRSTRRSSTLRPCRWMLRSSQRAEALDQRDDAAVALGGLRARRGPSRCRVYRTRRHHLQHRRDEFGLRGQKHAQRNRQRQHRLPHRHMRDDVVHQVRCGARHRTCPASGAKARALAAEGQQLVVAAFAAVQPQETVGQDAAFEKGVELVFDEARQLRSGTGLGVGDEAGRMLLHQAVQGRSARGGAARSGAGRRPAPSGAVGRRLAREAPEVVSSDGLKLAHGVAIALSGAYLRVPACRCLPSGG